MLCLACEEEFNEPRFLKDLFRTKKFYTCLECVKKYPIDLKISMIPLNGYMLEIVTLYENDKRINYDAFLNEYSIIYKKIVDNNQNKLVITVDKFYLIHDVVDEFESISTLIDKDIIVLTNILYD